MNFRTTMLAVVHATILIVSMAPSVVDAAGAVYLDAPPPPLRLERPPKPREGYVWIPGYWDVRGSHHVWRSGHWEPARRGYRYLPSTWVHNGDRWELQRGQWIRENENLASR
jgi:hypothetical protein